MRKIDPRAKLLQTVLTAIVSFVINSDLGMAIHATVLLIFMLYLGLRKAGLKSTAFFIALFMFKLFILNPYRTEIASVVSLIVFTALKLYPFFVVFFIIIKTVDVTELICAMERMHMPRSFVLALAVTMRFIPTVHKEVGYIRDAMKMRNIQSGLFAFLTHPIRTTEFIIVPLMMRSVRVSDELSAAAVTRAIERPGKRTSYCNLRIGFADFLYMGILLAFGLAITICEYTFFRGMSL